MRFYYVDPRLILMQFAASDLGLLCLPITHLWAGVCVWGGGGRGGRGGERGDGGLQTKMG